MVNGQWSIIHTSMNYSIDEFRRKSLFVHTFLADVPLHDVWAIALTGGGHGRTLQDVLTAVEANPAPQANPIVGALFQFRFFLGRLFGWDGERAEFTAASYIHHLAAADRARSLQEPGSFRGGFRVVYQFENESLGEIINGTVHAFSHMSLEVNGDDYILYWAIYVKKVSRLTPLYMGLIDPFRRFIVYPSVIKQIKRVWQQIAPTALQT
jgi:hypothetical protein